MEDIVSVKNLSYHYGGNVAVSNVTFSAKQGDYIALIGHNGSGKTTLMKLILGILSPTGGTVSLFGSPLSRFLSWNKIGYLPQNIGLFNPLFPATVAEVVGLGLISGKTFLKRTTAGDKERIGEALTRMNITKLQHKLIGELSGGQIQRTLLARAIVNEPELLILDEPVNAVDAETREEFFSYTGRLNKEKKTTIILITHDLTHSGGYANKFMYLDKHIIFYGDFKEFCISKEMKSHFGDEIQHIMCHQH